MTVEAITVKLAAARRRVEQLQAQLNSARGVSERATVGGLTGYDSAVLSGVRRRPDPRKTERRFAAYDREAKLTVALTDAEKDVARLERRLADAMTEGSRRRFTRDDLVGAVVVRDQFGWHKVIRVNQKSVSVDTGYSWVDRIPFSKVLEYREATP